MKNKPIAAISVAAGLLGGSAIGAFTFAPTGAVGQEDETTTESIESTESAQDDEARPEPGAWVDDALSALVDDGVLDQGQADAVKEALEEARPERGPFGHRPHVLGNVLDTAADTIGIERDALVDSLRDGQTVAEVAEANDVDPQVVIDALVANAEERLAEAVDNGRVDQERADEIAATIEERATDAVNGELRPRRPHGRGHHGPFGGPSGDADEETPDENGS